MALGLTMRVEQRWARECIAMRASKHLPTIGMGIRWSNLKLALPSGCGLSEGFPARRVLNVISQAPFFDLREGDSRSIRTRTYDPPRAFRSLDSHPASLPPPAR